MSDNLKKNDKILVIVESPNKVHTIKQILGSKYDVEASIGHITKIADSGLYNMGINPETFDADFVVEEGKKDIVNRLKEKVRNSGLVYLATDPDRS